MGSTAVERESDRELVATRTFDARFAKRKPSCPLRPQRGQR